MLVRIIRSHKTPGLARAGLFFGVGVTRALSFAPIVRLLQCLFLSAFISFLSHFGSFLPCPSFFDLFVGIALSLSPTLSVSHFSFLIFLFSLFFPHVFASRFSHFPSLSFSKLPFSPLLSGSLFIFSYLSQAAPLSHTLCLPPLPSSLPRSVCVSTPAPPPSSSRLPLSHLGVRQSQGVGQLASVRLVHVLLHLEAPLQPLALQVGEDGPRPAPLPAHGQAAGSRDAGGGGRHSWCYL